MKSTAIQKPAGIAKRPARKAPAAKKAVPVKLNLSGDRVVAGTANGGFLVFGSLVKPKHMTIQQIADAVADLD